MGMQPLLDAAEKRRTELIEKIEKITTTANAEGRTALTEDEAAKFEKHAAELNKLDKETIPSYREQVAREQKAAEATAETGEHRSPAVVTREPMTYDEHQPYAHQYNSYLRDLAYIAGAGIDSSVRGKAAEAERRMQRHMHELEVEARHNSEIRAKLEEVRLTPDSLKEQRVNPNTTAGTGGEFVPPLWLVSQYVPYVRPGRIFANRCSNRPLPPGIDVINLPKITLGAQTAIQAAQGNAVNSRDITTATVSASVRTIAGQEDISLQLLEQSPIAMDGVVFDDLSRDYDQQLDVQIVSGTGNSGQHLGVLNVSGATSNTSITNSNYVTVSSATFHDSSTSGTQYRSIVNGVNQIETLRFDSPTAIWVHPRRANSWAYSAVDSNNRPLFVPAKYGPFNALGQNEASSTPQGVAGELYGLPVIKDANMSTTMNGTSTTGGTADAVVVLKEDDLYLWEGSLRMRALPEILSGTLQIRFQVYAYSAFMPNRFPVSLSLLTGNTGLAAPGF